MKKLLSFLLAISCLFVFISCKDVDYKLEIEVVEKVFVGDESSFVVTLLPDNKVITDYECESSDKTIFTVSQGKITGVKKGNATLSVTYTCDKEEIKKSIEIEVFEKAVDYQLEVSFNENMVVFESQELKVVEKETNQTIVDYQVFNKNEDIIQIENGTVTAIKEGIASFVVSCSFGGKLSSKECTITVTSKLTTDIKLTVEKTELLVGEETSFSVEILPLNATNKEYEIILSDNNVLKVDDNKLIATNEGICTVKVVCKDSNISKEVVITVESNNIITTNIPSTLYVNQFIETKLFVNDQNIDEFNVSLSNEDIMFYDDETRILEPFDEGTCVLTFSFTYDGQKLEKSFEVKVIPGFELLLEAPSNMTAGEEATFEVYVLPDNEKINEFEASSSKTDVLEVQGNKLIAIAYGKATLVVNVVYKGVNLAKSVTINVERYIETSLQLNISNYMFLNKDVTLEAKLFPYNKPLTISRIEIDNGNIKYQNGRLVPVATGSTNVKIFASDGEKTYEKELNINIYEINDIVVESDSQLYLTEVKKFKVFALPSRVEITDYDLLVDNDNVLIKNGLVLGNNKGETLVSVSYQLNNKRFEKKQTIEVCEFVLDVDRLYLSLPGALLEGNSSKATVSSYPAFDDLAVVYSSSDENIATIDNNGNINAKNIGKVTITVKLATNENVYTKKEINIINKNEEMIFSGNTPSGVHYEGKYYEDSIKNYYELLNGITEVSYQAYTSTITENIDVDGYTGLDEKIVPGKYYSQSVHVLSIPSSTNTKVIPWANLGNNVWTLTTVKGLIQNYEELNPGKKVICAVNGDFFDIRAEGNFPYQTTGENVSDGEFYKITNSFGGGGGTLGFANDGSNLSLVTTHGPEHTKNMQLAIYDDNGNIVKTLEVENLNTIPQENQSSVYFGIYNNEKQYVPVTVPEGYDTYVVEKAEKALPNNANDFYGLGTITSTSPTTIQKGAFAIITNNSEVSEALKLGLRIRIQYEFTGAFANIKSATGYNTVIYNDPNQLQDGYLGDRAPRTVIGMKEDGTLIMMVVDGRQGGQGMFGCDGTELAAIMKTYGCVKAFNVDGGGSSTIVVRDESGFKVLNSPSDGHERNDGNCILVVTDDPGYKVETQVTSDSATLTVSNNIPSFENKKVLIDVEGTLYEVNNGVLTLNNLVHNTTYKYKVYYEENGKIYPTLTLGNFVTEKTGFKFLGAKIEERQDSFVVTVSYSDYDKTSNCSNMQIIINGTETFLSNDQIVLSKAIFGEYITSLQLNYWYIDNGEKYTVTLDYQDVFVK